MSYWEKAGELKARARKHTFNVGVGYGDEIGECIQKSVVYDEEIEQILPVGEQMTACLFKDTSTGALFKLRKDYGSHKRICVLNFASYKNPGGRFLDGSLAQEESLCHASFLYNVLKEMTEYYEWNMRNLNRGLYRDRAIYSPDVRFFDGTETVLADVLTCAAPNRINLTEYEAFTEEENAEALDQRVKFVKQILCAQNVDIAILGAWGCGVFQQNPAKVADLFMGDGGVPVNEIAVYAVPDDKTYGVFMSAMERHGCLPF